MTALLTIYELNTLSDRDLQSLHRRLMQRLMATSQGTVERVHILASLENIDRIQNARYAIPITLLCKNI